MDLDSQIQSLINDAPGDGLTPDAVLAIAPALKALASQLKLDQYYVLQTIDQNWVMTALSNRNQPETKKNIIYAYPTLKDVEAGPHPVKDPQVMALPVPVIHILFQMLAMKPVDSIIFFDTPGKLSRGLEVRRQDVQTLVQTQLQQQTQPNSQVPPDMA